MDKQFCIFWCSQVYDGQDSSSKLLGNFTKNDMSDIILNSTSNHLWMEFNSNGTGTSKGFKLSYSSKLNYKMKSG